MYNISWSIKRHKQAAKAAAQLRLRHPSGCARHPLSLSLSLLRRRGGRVPENSDSQPPGTARPLSRAPLPLGRRPRRVFPENAQPTVADVSRNRQKQTSRFPLPEFQMTPTLKVSHCGRKLHHSSLIAATHINCNVLAI